MEIKETKIKGRNPIAYTDFTGIFLSEVLNSKDEEVARIHELSHIWLQHYTRGISFKEKGGIDNNLLNIAMDMEIAIHIYTKEDESVIYSPTSFLHGGITKKDTLEYKSLYFEDIYYELLKKEQKGKCFDSHIFKDSKKQSKIISDKSKIVSSAIEKSKKDRKERKVKKDKEFAAQKVNQIEKDSKIIIPKPSMASEIDKVLGRGKIERVDSYRRPNRNQGQFLKKGRISKNRTPYIVVYVDRSGSFDSSKTQEATEELNNIIKKYRTKIKRDIIFFNDKLFLEDTGVGNGGTNYQAVIDNIFIDNPAIAIIVTDDDNASNVNVPNIKSKVIIKMVGCNNTDIAKRLRGKVNCIEI